MDATPRPPLIDWTGLLVPRPRMRVRLARFALITFGFLVMFLVALAAMFFVDGR